MLKTNYHKIIILTLFCLPILTIYSQIYKVSGKVSANEKLVKNASVIFINTKDTTQVYTANTNTSGFYNLDILTSIKTNNPAIPAKFELAQNYPNPFSNKTVITYKLNEQEKINLIIYNILGQEVRRFNLGEHPVGIHGIIWDGKNNFNRKVTPGIYFYTLQNGQESITRKMLLVTGDGTQLLMPEFNFTFFHDLFKESNVPTNDLDFMIKILNNLTTDPQIYNRVFFDIKIERDTLLNFNVHEIEPSKTLTVQGKVKTLFNPVKYADITFINIKDTTSKNSAITDTLGNFHLSVKVYSDESVFTVEVNNTNSAQPQIFSRVFGNIIIQSDTTLNFVVEEEDPPAFTIFFLRDSTLKIDEILNMDLSSLKLDSIPWITSEDIEFYDWSSHFIYLKEDKKNFLPDTGSLLHSSWNDKPWIVFANNEPCYAGCFRSSLSSKPRISPYISELEIGSFYPNDIITFQHSLLPDDVRNNESVKQALIEDGVYHAGIQVTFDSSNFPIKIIDNDISTVEYTIIIKNNDQEDLYIFDPDKVESKYFHYYNNGPYIGNYGSSFKTTKSPDAWDSTWYSLIKSEESLKRTISMTGYSPIQSGVYTVVFEYSCPNISKSVRETSQGRYWIGQTSANSIEVIKDQTVEVSGNVSTEMSSVKYAELTFYNSADTTVSYSAITDSSGNYKLPVVVSSWATVFKYEIKNTDNTQPRIYRVIFDDIIIQNDTTLNFVVEPLGSWRKVNVELPSKLNDIYFADTNNGWIVGDSSTILHSNDGGQSWQTQLCPVNETLKAVDFINEKTGWILSQNHILKTTDGGKNWEIKYRDSLWVWPFGDLQFVNDKIGFVACIRSPLLFGTVFKTTDGGESWNNITKQNLPYITHISIIDENNIWVCGGLTYSVLSTTDSGLTWIRNQSAPSGLFSTIQFIDQYNGWISGNGFYKTTNGGNTWTEQKLPIQTPLFYPGPFYFVDLNYGWLAPDYASETNSILQTKNGGNTWEIVPVDIDFNEFTAVFFKNKNLGWAVGTEIDNSEPKGVILLYTQ